MKPRCLTRVEQLMVEIDDLNTIRGHLEGIAHELENIAKGANVHYRYWLYNPAQGRYGDFAGSREQECNPTCASRSRSEMDRWMDATRRMAPGRH